MEKGTKCDGVKKITFVKGKVILHNGNKIHQKQQLFALHKYVTLNSSETQSEKKKTQSEDTDPLYIESECSLDESDYETNFEQCKKNIKQYVPKHRRNDNAKQQQKQLEIPQQQVPKDTENENIKTHELLKKDDMRQYVAKHRENELQHSMLAQLLLSKEKPPVNSLKRQAVINQVSNFIVNRSAEFEQSHKKQCLPKFKDTVGKDTKKTELPKDREYHINFSPGVSGEHRNRLLKGIHKYSRKRSKKQREKNDSWYKVTIADRDCTYEIIEPKQSAESINDDTDEDIVEHPAQSVTKKYQTKQHTSD